MGKPSTPNIGGGDTGGGGDQKRSRAGPAFAELAGPTRDLLVELLRPLTNLNILTGYWQQGLALLTQIRDNTAVLSAPSIASAMSVSPAGAGALAGPTIVFDLSRLTEPGYADAQIEAINRALGGVAKIQKRTGGGG